VYDLPDRPHLSIGYSSFGREGKTMRPIVCKFGGTSVATADQVRKVEAIIRSDPRRRYIVVSAPGKRHTDDIKITDLLYTCANLAEEHLDFSEPYGIIMDRYLEIARSLEVDLDALCLLEEVQEQIASGASRDVIASRGEYLCGRIVAALLGAEFVDPAEEILLTRDRRLNRQTYERLEGRLQGGGMFVIPGFYGADAEGNILTFPRGGSDITGAIVARAVEAEVYENWTDVSGLLMTNPKIVEDPKPIREVTYRELRELSYMGAEVLHEEAIFPVRELDIPINIRNTNESDHPGTMIVTERTLSDSTVIGIAGRPDFSMIYIEKVLMNIERGFGRKVLEILESHDISYEHSPTGIDSMSVIVSDEQLGAKDEIVLEDIWRILEPDRVELIRGMALIATVGHGMSRRVGIAARLFDALASTGINVRIIDQGSSEINIIVGVEVGDYEQAVKAIYNAFVE